MTAEEAKIIRRHAGQLARIAKKFETELAPGYLLQSRQSEMLALAHTLVARLRSHDGTPLIEILDGKEA